VVVRVALHLDPENTRVHAVSDPLPTILAGIPLDLRSIALKLDRPNFTSNPTSCDPMALGASATSVSGQSSSLSNPFQVGGCSSLRFSPRLSLRVRGGTERRAHPALRANLTLAGKGTKANLAKAQLTLPRSLALDRGRIGGVCSAAQFAARHCPPTSLYGHAKAITPLLDKPLRGPIYLRASNHKLPDLLVDLKGEVEISLAAHLDSEKGRLRLDFNALPDAPIEKLSFELKGGRQGLLVNRKNLCKKGARASASFAAQNGKTAELSR